MAGRGFGKTRVGAETVRWWVKRGYRRIHLVGPTASDARDVMVCGESGLLSVFPPWDRPKYEPSKRLITFKNGAVAYTFSAEEPERLRGPQCEAGWCDEVASWRFPEAYDNFLFGLRLGRDPRAVITSTPKPNALTKSILTDKHTVITRGTTYENRSNLAQAFYDAIIRKYEGSRLGRQELLAELLTDTPGALWTRDLIDATRIKVSEIRWDLFVRIVVAIDPAVTHGEDADETGIVVAGVTVSQHVVILDDLSMRGSPLEWAKVAIGAYEKYKADRIVAEVNNGGDLVGANLYAVSPQLPFRAVRASRGKMIRAEPIAALYEQRRAHHAGHFGKLEDEMTTFTPNSGADSPDRMDALVWAVTDLLIDQEDIEQTVLF